MREANNRRAVDSNDSRNKPRLPKKTKGKSMKTTGKSGRPKENLHTQTCARTTIIGLCKKQHPWIITYQKHTNCPVRRVSTKGKWNMDRSRKQRSARSSQVKASSLNRSLGWVLPGVCCCCTGEFQLGQDECGIHSEAAVLVSEWVASGEKGPRGPTTTPQDKNTLPSGGSPGYRNRASKARCNKQLELDLQTVLSVTQHKGGNAQTKI
jgi:hypothetical protein